MPLVRYVIEVTYRHKHYLYHDKVVNYEIDVNDDTIYIPNVDLQDIQHIKIRRVGGLPNVS